MKAFTTLFGVITALAFLCVGLFFYFSMSIDLSSLSGPAQARQTGKNAATAPAAPALTEQESRGKALFTSNCAACHKPVGQLVGPQLAGVQEKYADDQAWLYRWVKNSPKLIQDGDAKALALYEQYGKQQMTAFPTLKNEEIDAILAYADAVAN